MIDLRSLFPHRERAKEARREKLARLRRGDALDPADWRGATPADAQIVDSAGRPGAPRRTFDTLAALRRAGKRPISAAEYRAGRRFQDIYDAAGLDQPPAMDPASVRVDGGGAWEMPDLPRGTASRRSLDRAMRSLGGYNSISGKVALDVLGERRTLQQVAVAHGLGDGRDGQTVAKGLVLGALDLLARHFRIV